MWRVALRGVASHRLRLALTTLAIVLGVSFVSGTLVFTDSLGRSLDSLFNQRGPDVTVEPVASQVEGGQRSMPQSDVARVAAVPGVAVAEGSVSSRAAVVLGPDGKPLGGGGAPAQGRSWVEDPAMNPLTVAQGRPPAAAGEVALDRSTASRAGAQLGSTVRLAPPKVVDGSTTVSMTVVGILDDSLSVTFGGGTLAVMTLPEAQRLLLAPGRVGAVRVMAAPGVSQDELAGRVKAVMGAGYTVTTGQAQRDRAAQRLEEQLSFLGTFLLVFALIALFVATFLIYNTFSMLVAQRTRELALLRAIGASRRQVRGVVLLEALVVSLVASAIGLVVGVGLALLLRSLFGLFGAALPGGPPVVTLRTVALTFGVGVVVTLVSAWFPARRAARIPPVAALRDDVALPARSLRVRAVVAAVLVLLAALLALRGLRLQDDGSAAARLIGVSALCGLVAAITAAAVLARPVLGVLGLPLRGTVGRLARENGRRNPRRTAATSAALTIGVALMASLSVIAASASASVAAVVDQTLGADFVLFGTGFRPFPAAVLDAVQGTPGIAVATGVRQSAAQAEGGVGRTIVTGVEPAQLAKVLHLTFQSGSLESLAPGEVLVDTDQVKSGGYSVGTVVTLTTPDGPLQLRVAGVYEPAALYRGFIVDAAALPSTGVAPQYSAVYLGLAEGADAATVRADLDRRLAPFPLVSVQDQSQLKEAVSSQINAVLGFLFALLALAVLIAVLGIVNTLLLSVVERTREIGLLRAVGATRAQVRRMVVLESVLIALFGAVVGVVVGVLYGALLQRALAAQGISVLAVPWLRIALLVVLAALGGVLAALWPARRAARLDVLASIAVE